MPACRRRPPRMDFGRLSGVFLKGLDLAPFGEARERLRLDLADAFSRHSDDPADLLERLRIAVAVHPVPELDDLLLALRERLDRLPHRALGEADVDLLH